jgi:hypothetical protein
MPRGGINCQYNFTLLHILSQIDSFMSYDLKNIVNDVMDGIELEDVKWGYIENIQ